MKTENHCFDECTFVIFGATGDLSKRKLIPAIYKLIDDKKLCKFTIVGVSFEDKPKEEVLEASKKFIKNPDQATFEKLTKLFDYYSMDFYDTKSYSGLKELLKKIERKRKLPGNRIFYFATMPDHFVVITKNLYEANIVKEHPHTKTKKTRAWSRAVYEKPFGSDLKSSREINKYLASIFDEREIFRIDHYLGKELVGNIAMARFTNRVLEPLWNNKHIDSVQIIMSETIGIDGRGGYYDSYGATKDMIQSHALQLLALTAMEAPEYKLSASYIRNAKANVLKKVKVESVIRGQYEGYTKEKLVNPKSKTDTFVALKLSINNKRWKGVPFYIKTGKKLDKKDTSIHIKFKEVKCLIDWCPADSNYLTIQIQPDESFYLELNTKKPYTTQEVTPIKMAFSHSTLFGPNTPEAYEVLLADIVQGDQSAFIRSDEIDLSWKIVEQIDKLDGKKIYQYPQGSKGPKEMKKLDKKRTINWRA